MRVGWLVLLVGCFSPKPPAGAPCDLDHPCPAGLICAATGTCERSEVEVDPPSDSAPPPDLPPGCFEEICGDGIDQDCDGSDIACVDNDTAGGAIDVTAGGTFSSNLQLATDDLDQTECNGRGGRDVFYRVDLAAPEVYYFDTFASDFDTTIRVFPGKQCSEVANEMPSCSDDECNGDRSRVAMPLPSGASCVVVDRAAGTTGGLELRVRPGGRNGAVLTADVTGNTCGATKVWDPPANCTESDAPDLAFFFTICPSETAIVNALTCSSTTSYDFDTVLYLRRAGSNITLECNDDDSDCPVRPNRTDGQPDGSVIAESITTSTGDLYWLVIDGFDEACGNFTITNSVTIQ